MLRELRNVQQGGERPLSHIGLGLVGLALESCDRSIPPRVGDVSSILTYRGGNTIVIKFNCLRILPQKLVQLRRVDCQYEVSSKETALYRLLGKGPGLYRVRFRKRPKFIESCLHLLGGHPSGEVDSIS